MELINGEILDRNLEHDLAAVLGLGLHAQPELVVDDRHQVRGHLQYQGIIRNVGIFISIYEL